MIINPREYQLEAIEAVANRRSLGITRQLICLPTGTGKTVIFALLAKSLNLRTLVLAHSSELIKQAVDKFKIVWPDVDIGIVKAASDEVASQVVVASVQTATRDRRLKRLKAQNFELLIIDEAHHSAAASYEKIVKELGFFDDDERKLLVGVTATPKRADGIGLNSVFQELVFDRSMSTMIRAGYLAPLVGKQVFTKVEIQRIGISRGDFVSSELARIVNIPERNQLIAEKYKKYASDRKKSLAFCVNVKHAKDLAETFNQNGISAKAIYGAMNDEERTSTLSSFQKGEISILTNCQLLTEGFDSPAIDCVIMSRPTQSATLFTQMIGRGTRNFPLKKNCLILDFTDNATKHRLCTFKNTLDGAVACLPGTEEKEISQEANDSTNEEISAYAASKAVKVLEDRVEDIEFFGSAHFAWTPVGDSWHLILASNRDVWVRQVEGGFLVTAQNDGELFKLSSRPLPLDYALGVAEDWSRKQTTKSAWAKKDAAWRTEPASKKQTDTLTRLGFVFDNISKGEASQLLDSKFNEVATSKQIWWLKRHGVTFETSLTKHEARKLISINSRK